MYPRDLVSDVAIREHRLEDDGTFPNNATLPLVIYPGAVKLPPGEPPGTLSRLFAANGWGGSWVDGIFAFPHYHSTAHEVLGIAAGRVTVRFGGPGGVTVEAQPGDVIAIPAGVAHENLGDSGDLVVVGAYPEGQDWDLCRGAPDDRPAADENIARVPLPRTDPLHGADGPLVQSWSPGG